VQSLLHDAAESPLAARMIVGQGVLMVGCASLYALLALRERGRRVADRAARGDARQRSRRAPRPRGLAVATAAAGVALAWATFAFISRTRAFPAITALATYGRALQQYLPPLRPLGVAA
jgi:hypothetical protein